MTSTHYRKRTAEDWTNSLISDDFNIVGTLKFHNGRSISRNTALTLVSAYWHKVDKVFFGKAADKGYGIERWCFSEYGADGDNLHIHFIAQAPVATLPTCAILNALWVNFNRSTASYHNNWITPITHKRKAIAYTVKGTRLQNTDPINENASHTNALGTHINNFDTDAQIRRISNRLSAAQLLTAQHALNRHIQETELRMARRSQQAQQKR